MTFAVAADAYDRFMGRYSVPLAPTFADFAEQQEMTFVVSYERSIAAKLLQHAP